MYNVWNLLSLILTTCCNNKIPNNDILKEELETRYELLYE